MIPNDTTVERNKLAVYGALTGEWQRLPDIMYAAVALRGGIPITSDVVEAFLRKMGRAGIAESRRDGKRLVWRKAAE